MPVSDETRLKLSEARRAWWERATPEQLARLKERQSGPRPQTSAALKGKPKAPRVKTGRMVPCDQCGTEFYCHPFRLERFPHHFCSRACSGKFTGAAKKIENTVTCIQCGKVFDRTPGRAKYNGGNHLCSTACVALWRTGQNHHNWNGGRWKFKGGYIMVAASLVPDELKCMLSVQNNSLFEHRLVMAQHLGRPLEDWEVVHHKNGIKDDNRVENLEVHSAHAHHGITNAERKDVNALRRENAALRAEVALLKARLGEGD